MGIVTVPVPDPAGASTPRRDPAAAGELQSLRDEVARLVDGALRAEATQADRIAAVRPEHRVSAANLVHYVWLRGRDIRNLQGRLADLGLSSLGRLESRVLPTLRTILGTLDLLLGCPVTDPQPDMDVARLNCAHDGPEAWAALIANLRAAQARPDGGPTDADGTGPEHGDRGSDHAPGGQTAPDRCLVAMDLAGPDRKSVV